MNQNKTYFIAEAGVNHNGDKAMAIRLIEEAAMAGANAIKFQTFNAKKITSKTLEKANYQKKSSKDISSQYEMLKKLELPKSFYKDLISNARKMKIDFISTPFDYESLSFLNSLRVPFFKIPSGEINNLPFLWKIANLKKNVILSTGMSNLSDIELALAVLNHGFISETQPKDLDEVWALWSKLDIKKFRKKVSILHCLSNYPAKDNEINLNAIKTLKKAFKITVGFSDHSLGIHLPIGAIALGAKIIEKHLTLDKNLDGPDHSSSLEPKELKRLIENIRSLENALGDGIKKTQKNEWEVRDKVRKKIVASRKIKKGEKFSSKNLKIIRAETGLYPENYWNLLGTISNKNYSENDSID